ncbi:FG-GAP-like repeat-containing protein [Nitrospira sp. Ecomares 2.1]
MYIPTLIMMLLSVGLTTLPHTAQAAIALQVEVNPDPALAGELLDVQFTVTNTGGTASGNVTLSFVYPAGLNSISDLTKEFPGDCIGSTCEPGETAVVNVGTLPAGKGKSVSLRPRISGSATPGSSIVLNVDALENSVMRTSASSSITVATSQILNLVVAESQDPVSVGDALTFTLDFGVSISSAGSPNAILSFPLPAGTTFQSATQGGSLVNNNRVDWSLGSLNPGESGQRSLTVTVNGNIANGTILHTEAVFSDSAVPANQTRTSTTTRVQAPVSMDLRISATPNPVMVGELIDLELTVTNVDTVSRSNVTVALKFPDEFVSLSESLFAGDCVGSTCEPGEVAIFSVGTLAAGKGLTISLPPQVAAGISDGRLVRIEASATDTSGDMVEASTSLRVRNTRDRDLRIAVDRDPVAPGQNMTYTFSYGILSSGAGSPNAKLSLKLPEGTSFVSASNGGMLNNNVVEWALGPLNPGEGGIRTAVLTASSGLLPGSSILAESMLTDSVNPSNEVQANKVTQVKNEIPLELAITTNADPAKPGQLLDIEIVLANPTTLVRSNISVSLEYPSNMESVSEGLIEGDCIGSTCEASETMTFTVGTLAAGKGKSFSLPVRIANPTIDGRLIDFQAEITDSTGVQIRRNVVVRVDSSSTLQLALEDNIDPAVPSEIIEYRLAYGELDTGGSVPNAQMQLVLPPEMTFVSATGGSTESGGTVTWNLGGLNPGEGGQQTVLAQVGASVGQGMVIHAQASLSNGGTPMKILTASQATRVEPVSPLELQVVANPNPALPGEILDVEVSVANRSALSRSGVLLRLEYVDGLSSLSESLSEGGDCLGSTCEAQERLLFNIGTLAAGTGKSFSVPAQVVTNSASGSVLVFRADLTDSTGDLIRSADTLVIDSSRELQLALSENRDPVVPGETFTYTLTLAALEPGLGAANGTLRLQLPSRVTLNNASNGGTISGDTVSWVISGLNAGEGATRTATVQLSASAELGSLLRAHAELEDGLTPPNPNRISSVARVQNTLPLNLAVSAKPNPADPGELLDIDLLVGNSDSLSRTGVTLVLEYPAGLNSLFTSGLSGTCPGSSCESPERLIFNVGTLTAGQEKTVSIPPTVARNTPNGTIINFDAFLSDSTGAVRESSGEIFVGRVIANDVLMTVTKAGTGNGTVTSSPTGITCGVDCSEMYSPGTAVLLTPIAGVGSIFSGWSGGGCSGTGSCTVTPTSDVTVVATFSLLPPPPPGQVTLQIVPTGRGSGTVTSSPAGISCGSDCSEFFSSGTGVTLTAVANPGSLFLGWSGGACSGTAPCVLPLTANTTVSAVFGNPSVTETRNDLDGDGRADLLWRNTKNGSTAIWLLDGSGIAASGFPGGVPLAWQVAGIGDVNGDGKADVIWRHSTSATVAIWLMNGVTITSVGFPASVPRVWSLQTVGDVNGDGKADLLWRNSNDGNTVIWLMNGTRIAASGFLGKVSLTWQLAGAGDINGDGKADLIWHNGTSNALAVWVMNGLIRTSVGFPGSGSSDFQVAGVGDVNGDGRADLVWRNSKNGEVVVWLLNGTTIASTGSLGGLASEWQIVQVADTDGDGITDVFWRNNLSGQVAVWKMNGLSLPTTVFPGKAPTDWEIQ